ncbi:CLUMA_CG012771, isoform A [Clunio marinus]|uniref:CLUMA_CG012771, isoform A n=1 Tax=Clunio marinus TaxID=568069 RepID=A0A1J1IGF7_9DIPT|nr:CLUMA_CG012771, isoform A [Clunio marinus]
MGIRRVVFREEDDDNAKDDGKKMQIKLLMNSCEKLTQKIIKLRDEMSAHKKETLKKEKKIPFLIFFKIKSFEAPFNICDDVSTAWDEIETKISYSIMLMKSNMSLHFHGRCAAQHSPLGIVNNSSHLKGTQFNF